MFAEADALTKRHDAAFNRGDWQAMLDCPAGDVARDARRNSCEKP